MTASAFYLEGELHAAVFPEPLFLVDSLVPMQGIVMLHGPKTAGKTQLALTLGVAVATGTPFLGQYACTKGRVLFIEADMPRKMFQNRILQAPATKSLCFIHTEPFDIVSLMAKGLLPDAFRLAQETKPTLVIVDSLRKTSSQDEMDSLSPSRVYGGWRKLFPEACLAIIHHDRKAPTSPDAIYRPEEAARGSGAWLDDIDTGFQMSKIRNHKSGGHVATLSLSKCRYSEDPQPITVLMDEETLMVRAVGKAPKVAIKDFVDDHPGASRQELVQHLVGTKVCSQATAYRLASEAIITEILTHSQGGYENGTK